MDRARFGASVAAASMLFIAACGDSSSETEAPTTTVDGEAVASTQTTADGGTDAAEDGGGDFEDLDSATFTDPTTVDNRYLPLVPGTQHVYEGVATEDDQEVDRRIVHIVTDLTKEINGVETVVVWERDFNDDELAESEIAFFAQDDEGNVWHFGQYRETYEGEEFVGGRIWLVDLPAGAKAGIIMPADPQAGSDYSQGFAPPPFHWTDRAAVGETGAETCIGDDECFTDVLVTEESDAEHPGAFQLKYFAPDIGNVRVGFRGPDPEQEELELVEDVVLDEEGLAEARAEGLGLEERGYMYSKTTPAQPRS